MNRLRLVDEHDLDVVSVDESDDFDEATDDSEEAGVSWTVCRLSVFVVNDVLLGLFLDMLSSDHVRIGDEFHLVHLGCCSLDRWGGDYHRTFI